MTFPMNTTTTGSGIYIIEDTWISLDAPATLRPPKTKEEREWCREHGKAYFEEPSDFFETYNYRLGTINL